MRSSCPPGVHKRGLSAAWRTPWKTTCLGRGLSFGAVARAWLLLHNLFSQGGAQIPQPLCERGKPPPRLSRTSGRAAPVSARTSTIHSRPVQLPAPTPSPSALPRTVHHRHHCATHKHSVRRDGQIHWTARKTKKNVLVLAAGGGRAGEAASQDTEHETTQSCLSNPCMDKHRSKRRHARRSRRPCECSNEAPSKAAEEGKAPIFEKPQRGSSLFSSLTQHSSACHCHCLPVNSVKREPYGGGQSLGLRSNRPRLWTKLSLHGQPRWTPL